MMRSIFRNPAWVGASALAGLVLAGNARAGYLNNDPNDALDPQFNPANYASQVITSAGSIGQRTGDRLYNSPGAVLGAPNLWFLNNYAGDLSDHQVKIIEPPANTSPNGNPLITQLNNLTLTSPKTANPGIIEVKMGSPVYAAPTHPYGIDFIVYGNSYFAGSGGVVDDSTNLNNFGLTGLLGHSTSVSVSQDGVHWYTYPDVSALVPYNAYDWNRAGATWTSQPADQLKPVNPGVVSFFPTSGSGGSGGVSSAADVLDLYCGASGGTGYSLQGTGMSYIQYIKVTPGNQGTLPNSTYTVVTAFAATRSMVVGDNLTIAPANINAGTGKLSFVNPSNASQTMVSADFKSVSNPSTLTTGFISKAAILAPITGPVLGAYQLNVTNGLQTAGGSPSYSANLQLLAGGYVGNNYQGNGSDLAVSSWTGSAWQPVAFSYDPSTHLVSVQGWLQLSSSLVVSQNALPGDANLDGRIAADDYMALDLGYLFGLSGWSHGDFNNSGKVDAADFAIIDHEYGLQHGSSDAGEMALHEQWFGVAYTDALEALGGAGSVGAAVPEPASLGVMMAAVGLLLLRQRGCRPGRA